MYSFLAIGSLLFYLFVITSLLFSPVMWPLGIICWVILIGGVFMGANSV